MLTYPHTEQCSPSVKPFVVHVAATAGVVTIVWLATGVSTVVNVLPSAS